MVIAWLSGYTRSPNSPTEHSSFILQKNQENYYIKDSSSCYKWILSNIRYSCNPYNQQFDDWVYILIEVRAIYRMPDDQKRLSSEDRRRLPSEIKRWRLCARRPVNPSTLSGPIARRVSPIGLMAPIVISTVGSPLTWVSWSYVYTYSCWYLARFYWNSSQLYLIRVTQLVYFFFVLLWSLIVLPIVLSGVWVARWVISQWEPNY